MRKTVGRPLAFVLCALACTTSAEDDAQQTASTIRVPDEPSCARCSITTRTVVTLEVPPDTTDGFPVAVHVDSQARYWVFRRGDLPALFDSTGRYLQVLGRTGRGPGEYENAYDLLLIGRDTLLVLDQNRRGTFLNTSLTPVRYTRLPMQLNNPIVVSWPGTVMGSGNMPYRESRGPLYHLSFAGQDAEVVRQFQSRDGEFVEEMMFLTWHELTTPRNRKFWSAWNNNYDLSQFTADGTRLRSLERRPAWFDKPSPMNYDWKNLPPPPHVADIEEDSEGLLWIFIHVASPSWKEAWPVVPKEVREVPARLIDNTKLWRTTLEVIDPRRGRVVARRELDGYLIAALPGRRAATYEEDDTGGRVVMVQLDIVRR